MLSIFFGERFDFLGLGVASTNKSAAVLACALLSCGWFWLQSKRRWQLAGLALGAVLSVLLVATQSRGGLIAAACGLGLLAGMARPRFSRWIWLLVWIGGCGLIAYGSLRGVWGRFAYGDDSRSGLWRAGLAMLWDFPQGVGAGNAPSTFAQWYQELGDRRGYLSLINFHLTWLAERGLFARIAYVLSWAGLAWMVWPKRSSASSIIAASVWLSFFVAAIFSTIATAWQLWVIPLAWLALVLAWRLRTRDWPARRVLAGLSLCAVAALGALHLVGWHFSDPRLSVTGRHEVRFGRGAPQIVIYEPNPGVLGSQWGYDIRSQSGTVGVRYGESASATAASAGAVWILSGTHPPALPPKTPLRIYNMVATPGLLAWLERQAPASVRVVLSDSLWRELHGDDWLTWADNHGAEVKLIGGTGLYVPDWMPADASLLDDSASRVNDTNDS